MEKLTLYGDGVGDAMHANGTADKKVNDGFFKALFGGLGVGFRLTTALYSDHRQPFTHQ